MKMYDMSFAVVIIAAMLGSCIMLLSAIDEHVRAIDTRLERVEEMALRVHLPTKCQPYYNDGTDRWKECMGVGYK